MNSNKIKVPSRNELIHARRAARSEKRAPHLLAACPDDAHIHMCKRIKICASACDLHSRCRSFYSS